MSGLATAMEFSPAARQSYCERLMPYKENTITTEGG